MADYEHLMGTEMNAKEHPSNSHKYDDIPDMIESRHVDDIISEGNNPSASTRFSNEARSDELGGSDLTPTRVEKALRNMRR